MDGGFIGTEREAIKIWIHPELKIQIPVPDHGNREIDPGLLRGIRKQTGI
ncbi:MAG: type II toxin-antitoxin system HicA family toxin [Victivallales bacterium]|nr:type II toxin-antitoxin system HicA family toxin [Victivallales bacterium]